MFNHFYDPVTKEYLRSDEVVFSKKGEALPALDATRIPPPKEKESYARIFCHGVWGYVKDHRQKMDPQKGKTGGTPFWLPSDTYQSEPRYMDVPGDLPKDALLKAPLPPLPVLREIKIAEMKEAYENAREKGCPSSLGFVIDADDKAIQSIQGLIAITKEDQSVFFRDFENHMQEVSLKDLKQMLLDIALWDKTLKEKKWAYQEKMNKVSEEELLEMTFLF